MVLIVRKKKMHSKIQKIKCMKILYKRKLYMIYLKVVSYMSTKDGIHKPGSINPIQKGARRQNLHSAQNDVGNPKNEPKYENFSGEPIK